MIYKLTNKLNLIQLSFIILLFDQITKSIATKVLNTGLSVILVPNLISLRLVKNTGAAFSLFSNSTKLLGILSLLVALFILMLIRTKSGLTKWNGISLAFLLGGTLGNGIDRWTQGYVIDFIEFLPIQFPIFNIADIAINIAIVCFLIETLRSNS